jgi:WG containing repeat
MAFDMLYPFPTLKANGAESLVGFIDTHGQVVVQPSYVAGSLFFEGKASVVDTNGKSGFLDCTGNLAIPCRFQGISDFRDGVCSINCGFIDHSGRWFIEPQFLIASHFSEGRASASMDGETFGFIDLTGKFAIPPDFQQCGDFSDGLAAVCRDERWGFVDHSGEIRIPFVFETSRALTRIFRNGVAGVKIDGRCGFIDHSGGFIVRPEYEDLKSFSEGHAPVRQNGKWGMINLDGRLVVDCRFDELGELNGGLAFAKADGKAGFVSYCGSWVIQPEFDRCYPFFGALALVRKAGGIYSYLRRNGEVVWTSETGTQFQVPYVVRSA